MMHGAKRRCNAFVASMRGACALFTLLHMVVGSTASVHQRQRVPSKRNGAMRRPIKNGAPCVPLVVEVTKVEVTKGPAADKNTGSYAERRLDTSVANVWGTSVLLTVSCTKISSTAAQDNRLRGDWPFVVVRKRRV